MNVVESNAWRKLFLQAVTFLVAMTREKNLPDTLKFKQIFLGYEETQKFEHCVIFHCQLS